MKIKHSIASKLLWILILFTFIFPPAIITSTIINLKVIKMKYSSPIKASLYPSVFDLNESDKDWIEETINKMSIRDKCAQMVMPWVLGNYISEDSKDFKRLEHLVKNQKVGGFIFFKGDILNEALIINKIQELSDIPLLIASDFERGLGMRLIDGTEFPYNMALAATGDLELAYQMGKVVSIESRALGVHQNYAPVADINSNPDNPIINIRAYSEDKDIVSQFGSAFIAGSIEERVLTTAKHFPGHGNTSIDSHNDMPVINIDKLNLANNELVPFVQAIKAGVHSIMIGHLSVPAIEPDNLPATLSKRIITHLLKGEMGFEGLIVTDAMNMSAITKYYSTAEASVMAIQAGNDILLIPPDEEVAINAIYSAVESGEISIERINSSVRKILAAKRWLKIDPDLTKADLNNITKIIGQKSHLNLAEKIAEKSITLVKNEGNIIPIDPAKVYRTACISITDGSISDGNIFQDQIYENFGYVSKFTLNKKSTDKDYEKALQQAGRADLILLPSYIKVKAYQGTINLSETNLNFINKILELNKPAIIFSFGNPYLLSLFPDAGVYLTAYGDSPFSQLAMFNAVVGNNPIQGKLPISIPNTPYKLGDGIEIGTTSLKHAEEEVLEKFDLSSIDVNMINAVNEKVFPGGVLLIGKEGKIIYEKPFGNFTYDKNSTPMSTDAIFDLASLTKVVGTTTAAMILYDEKKLNLDEKVSAYLPEFGNKGKENFTVRNLLEHNSGLPEYGDIRKDYPSKDELLNAIFNEELEYTPGRKNINNDFNMIILQKVIEKLSGKTLDQLLKERVFDLLNMNRTMFNPPKELYYYTPPTSDIIDPKKRNKGVVHDGNAFLLDGVAGHAGLFSTAEDLAVFAQMMLQKGKYGKRQIIKSSTIEEWTNPESNNGFTLGWDLKPNSGSTAGNLFSKNSFGHTGFIGTSLWIDKERDLFVILLTNRVYPDGKNENIKFFRPKIHDAVIKALEENNL